MNTYSHLIVTAVLNKPLKRLTSVTEKLPKVDTRALLWGSIVPDLPLILLTIMMVLVDWARGTLPNFHSAESEPLRSFTSMLFRDWYFHNPIVLTLHNLFHSPILLICYLLISHRAWKKGYVWGQPLFWLSIGAMLHTLADIPLHTDDGPLVFFPLNWSWRFHSPLSYWDPQHHGREWTVFEHLLDLSCLVYLFVTHFKGIKQWLGRKFARQR